MGLSLKFVVIWLFRLLFFTHIFAFCLCYEHYIAGDVKARPNTKNSILEVFTCF